jgi:hypothetical protein
MPFIFEPIAEPNQSPFGKLTLRRWLLQALDYLSQFEPSSRTERETVVTQLKTVATEIVWCGLLMKELGRLSGDARKLEILAELLMEMGNLTLLKDPLWLLITSTTAKDDQREVAHVVLRHLGETGISDVFVDYLDNPEALATKETERLLSLAVHQPEATLEFVDFISTLPPEDQLELLCNMQRDFPSEAIVPVLIPFLDALPDDDAVVLQALTMLISAKTPQVAYWLQVTKQQGTAFKQAPFNKLIHRGLKECQLAGIYNPNHFAALKSQVEQIPAWVLTLETKACYASLPDGYGSQAYLLVLQWPHGDYLAFGMVINDTEGLLDAFSYTQVREPELNRLLMRFKDQNTKISIPPSHFRFRLEEAEAKSRELGQPIAYEYTAWKAILLAYKRPSLSPEMLIQEWYRADYIPSVDALLGHREFAPWILPIPPDREDFSPFLAQLAILLQQVNVTEDTNEAIHHENLKEAVNIINKPLLPRLAAALTEMDSWVNATICQLVEENIHTRLRHRLAEAACLLHWQNSTTYAQLAATASLTLLPITAETPWIYKQGFLLAYVRKTLLEMLAHFQVENTIQAKTLDALKQALLQHWQSTLPMMTHSLINEEKEKI